MVNIKHIIVLIAILIAGLSHHSHAGFLDSILKGLGQSPEKGLDSSTIVEGLKEALMTGTDNAVKEVSQVDGYLGNDAIKILMPEKIQTVADVLKKVGYQQQVDEFVGSMNRAAEKAAPMAASSFIDLIKGMSFDDARTILDGGDTAATDYFKGSMFNELYDSFKPSISSSMNDVGVTRAYKNMMDTYTTVPFVKDILFDIDDYVTTKALDGLFHQVAEEEKKIRTDPGARVTELLQKVFSASRERSK